jgi:UDP-N-acetylmuramoyl-L-alanyl-D-glutamate--2,6-diaminopimelate ligase
MLSDGAEVSGQAEARISGLTADSRAVQPGWLFAALPGSRADGARFVADAVGRGAAAILGGPELRDLSLPVPVVIDALPRRRLALMAAAFFGRQPRTVAAVTGTNGKTSTAVFTAAIWRRLGRPAASLGTLGLDAPGRHEPGSLTTPDPIVLQRLAAELAAAGIEHLVLEASSHGLAQHRLDGLRIRAAAFTNLTRDHHDYHGSVDAYREAKRRLFAELLEPSGVAVLNADVPEFELLAADARARGIEVLDYGRAARRLRLLDQVPLAHGQRVELEIEGVRATVELPLVGAFMAANALAALGLVLGTGGGRQAAVDALAGLEGAPGRMQLVARHPSGAATFVDYAHTPDALEQALRALRPHAAGRLVVVFGCGGDRDAGKRPVMGRIAASLADRAIVTDDNPRGEDPALIRAAVLAAAPGAIEIGDREAAIRAGFAGLEAGDVLLVAGKGHETGQTVAGVTRPFDDTALLRAIAGEAGGLPA